MLLGCSGEIGSRLTNILIKSGFEVYGIRGLTKCKVRNPLHTCKQMNLLDPSFELDFENTKPEILIHTAWVTSPNIFWESPQNNLWMEASKRIIKGFEQSGGKYLVVTSSCAEYSWEANHHLSEISDVVPKSNYGKSKLELLNWLCKRDITFLWTRIFFQFGLNEPAGRLIPSLIDSFIGETEFIVRSGNDIRDFVYIEDVVKILILLITKDCSGIINIGRGVGMEVKNVAQSIANLFDRHDLLRFEKNILPKSIVVSNSTKLISNIGSYSWMDFDEALISTIKIRKK